MRADSKESALISFHDNGSCVPRFVFTGSAQSVPRGLAVFLPLSIYPEKNPVIFRMKRQTPSMARQAAVVMRRRMMFMAVPEDRRA